MKPALAVLAIVTAIAAAAPDLEASALQRFLLVVGADDGGARRTRLKYALSDARRFSAVLTELGGVAAPDVVLLAQPGAKELEAGLAALRARVTTAGRASSGRTEVLVYYSGHADEEGLLLGADRYSYRALRDELDAMPADVRIAVLDACASGAITRLKGGKARPPFLVDAGASPRGHAFLTSSSADEAAQESDRLGASYFTHYLISGLRGAADTSGDGTVTLAEAYDFAFHETVGRTVDTRAGAQHPSYDINLSGAGQVVMTDVRRTSAGLALEEGVSGRCYVRASDQGLVVELRKPSDRRVELGLPPGRYEIRCQDERGAFVSRMLLEDGRHVVLGTADFSPARREAALARGDEPSRFGGGHRHRLDARFGLLDTYGGTVETSSNRASLEYSRRVRPHLSMGLNLSTLGALDAGIATSLSNDPDGTRTTTTQTYSADVYSGLVTLRYDLLGTTTASRWRPYLSAGLGPYVRRTPTTTVTTSTTVTVSKGGTVTSGDYAASSNTSYQVVLGARLGAGLDTHLGRRFGLGLWAGYEAPGDFAEAPWQYRRFELALGLSWRAGR